MGDLIVNMLSSIPLQKSILSYHSVSLIPVITIAAMQGLQLIKTLSLFSRVNLMLLLIIPFMISFFLWAPLIIGKNSFWQLNLIPQRDNSLSVINKLIPPQSSLSAQANIGSHFAGRQLIYVFPNKSEIADFIILRFALPFSVTDDADKFRFRFWHHIQMTPENYLASIDCLISDKNYKVHYLDNSWLVLSKTGTNGGDLYGLLQGLKKTWPIDLEKFDYLSRKCRLPIR